MIIVTPYARSRSDLRSDFIGEIIYALYKSIRISRCLTMSKEVRNRFILSLALTGCTSGEIQRILLVDYGEILRLVSLINKLAIVDV